jgi:hypothetical protein
LCLAKSKRTNVIAGIRESVRAIQDSLPIEPGSLGIRGSQRVLETMIRNSLSISLIIAAAVSLSGCGAINSSLSATMADSIPHWAGGLPLNVPPRPSDPKYAEYLAKLQGKAVIDAPKAEFITEIKSHSLY